LNEAALRLGVSLRQTEDQLTREAMLSTASAISCTNGANGQVPTNITQADISNVTSVLLGNNGYMFTSGIEGEDKFGTAPVRNAYFALSSTDLTKDLNNVNGFISQSNYPNQMKVLDSEWGAVDNVRFLVSSIGSKTPGASSAGRTVYNNFIVAKEAVGYIDQDGATAQFIYRPAQYTGPLAQNVTVGYKFACAPRVLNDEWIKNLQCTLTT
jgi:N4-gp56 family major capsid protein